MWGRGSEGQLRQGHANNIGDGGSDSFGSLFIVSKLPF